MTDNELRLEAGSVVALRFHDLGRVVDVGTLASRAGAEAERPRFPTDAGVRYGAPVVEIPLDDVEIPLEDGSVFADASIRVFDFGIAALALRVLVGGLDWERFTERVDEIAGAVGARSEAWNDVERRARTALQRASLAFQGEPVAQHVFVIARRFANPVAAEQLASEEFAGAIVSRDWLPLTPVAQASLLRGARIVGRDLVVAGDERTFIVEGTPGGGAPDVIEAALAQRACFDRVTAAGLTPTRGAGQRARRAAALISAERSRRLGPVYATVRDRLGVADAESAALRQSPPAGVPWLAVVATAVVTAILTTLLVLALT
ncbi:MAG TPA: hypothetical protein VF039_10370 [Longimicrobiales bacterium]